jgi:hypothetical protein
MASKPGMETDFVPGIASNRKSISNQLEMDLRLDAMLERGSVQSIHQRTSACEIVGRRIDSLAPTGPIKPWTMHRNEFALDDGSAKDLQKKQNKRR